MDAPPAYEFAVEDPQPRVSPFAKFLKPVYRALRVADPITRKWAEITASFEHIVSPYIEPFFAKRIVFLSFVLVVFFTLYWQGAPTPMQFDQLALMEPHIFEEIKAERIFHTANYFNSIPHLPGTVSGHTTAHYIHQALDSYGFGKVETSTHQVFLSHLNSHELKVEYLDSTIDIDLSEGKVLDQQPPPHMALGISGSCKGKLVYANFGSRSDLNTLRNSQIDLKDKVVVVRYGGGAPGLTVERLREWGAVGVIFFSHKEPNVEPWPNGPDYSEESVQRASLGIPQLWPGDVLSPGWPSNHHLVVPIENVRALAKLPVVSVSWKSIAPLLNTLKGHGLRVEDWSNNGYPNIEEWWTGGTQDGPEASLSVDATTEDRHTVYNVLARLSGTEQSERGVFIGASHDSFCSGGVKLSGVSVLLEVARALSYLSFRYNWQPLRSIYFTFWDASTLNYAGATEWMENLLGLVNEDGIIYIDLDKGVSGPNLAVEGNPSIDVREIIAEIDDKLSVDPEYRRLPWDFGTSDVFSSLSGVPAISLGMTGEVYPKDSCFDTIEWQNKFGDKDFSAHKKLADIVASIAFKYADAPIMPFNFTYFATQTEIYLTDLEEFLSAKLGPRRKSQHDAQIEGIRHILSQISMAGDRAEAFRRSWHLEMDSSEDKQEPGALKDFRLDWDERMDSFSKHLLHRSGLYHREWFRNPIFGPKYEASPEDTFSGAFPGIRDTIWLSKLDMLDEAIQIVSDALKDASQILLDAPYWG